MRWLDPHDPILTPVIRVQLAIFLALMLVALGVLGFYYLRLPTVAGVGQYTLYADLPASGGLYKTANVTYRGIQIGKVIDVEPTERGARATMSISDRYKIPVNASANVHSVSAIGEQYLDLVPTGAGNQYLADGQTVTKGTVPDEVGPALDSANRGLEVLPKEKIDSLLSEAAQSVGGLGPALQRLGGSPPALATDPGVADHPPGRHRTVGGQPQRDRRPGRRAGRGAAQRAAAGRAHRRSAQLGVQRCAGLPAGDAGQPRDRHRHAQALPQGRRAGAGVFPGGSVTGGGRDDMAR